MKQLKNELDNKIYRKLYIFTGEEREVMRRYIRRIDERAVRVSAFSDIAHRLTSKNLFSKSETYVIENDQDVTEMKRDDLLSLIGNNTLILIYDKVDERKKFFKENKQFIDTFDKFDEEQLIDFVLDQIDVDEDTAVMIAMRCNCDVARIENECHKLKHLAEDLPPWEGASVQITPQIVREMIEPPLEDRIFDMIDRVACRDTMKALKLYHDLIELKESPIKIVSVMYTKFKQIFLVQSNDHLSNNDIAKKTGLNYYAVERTRDVINEFDLERVIEILRMIQQTEVEMKTGQVDIDLGMNNLILNILR